MTVRVADSISGNRTAPAAFTKFSHSIFILLKLCVKNYEWYYSITHSFHSRRELFLRRIDLLRGNILVTGAAGFIGAALSHRLLDSGCRVVGIDNMNDYYSVDLKEYRLKGLAARENFTFIRGDISSSETVNELFRKYTPSVVVNLAAQAGVRYSIVNPQAYVQSNLVGFCNILEACRHCGSLEHLVFASSSSVYGGSTKIPFSVDDKTDSPVSLYAATKKSNELLAHAYSHLYGIRATGLRFFTVYGPAGRPDMAYFKFADTLKAGGTIQIFNYGKCERDFTYIDDIVEGVFRVMQGAPEKFSVYNIGGGRPENLLEFVDVLQGELVRAGVLPSDYHFEGHRELVPMQPGDVPVTFADSSGLERDFGFTPKIDIREGLRRFAEWYAAY